MTTPKSKPDPVPKIFAYGAPDPIKIATSNLFVDKDNLDVDYMTGLIFEDIGAMELSNIVRYDQLNTTDSAYGLVSNIAKTIQQTKLDFNLSLGNNNAIDLNDYIRKDFKTNLNVISVQQSLYGPGGTSSYSTYYVSEDLSSYDISSNFKVTTTGIGTIGGCNFDTTNIKVIETGNGYFKISLGTTSISKTLTSGKAQFTDYVPVYFESSLYNNNTFNDNYSYITIEISDNFDNYEIEVEFFEYMDKSG
jgi:hypothetical protein